MCLFTSARTAVIVFARSAGSEAMYCAGVLTFDAGFMDSSSSRTKCITERLQTSQRQEAGCLNQRVGECGRPGSCEKIRFHASKIQGRRAFDPFSHASLD